MVKKSVFKPELKCQVDLLSRCISYPRSHVRHCLFIMPHILWALQVLEILYSIPTSLHPLCLHLSRSTITSPVYAYTSLQLGLPDSIQPPYYGQSKFAQVLLQLHYPSITFRCSKLQAYWGPLWPLLSSPISLPVISHRVPCSLPPLCFGICCLEYSVLPTFFIPLIHIYVSGFPLETLSCPHLRASSLWGSS